MLRAVSKYVPPTWVLLEAAGTLRSEVLITRVLPPLFLERFPMKTLDSEEMSLRSAAKQFSTLFLPHHLKEAGGAAVFK